MHIPAVLSYLVYSKQYDTGNSIQIQSINLKLNTDV